MVPKKELNTAVKLAKEYGVGKLYLFGSSLHKKSSAVNDYDFAVAGIAPSRFFAFYGKLFRALSKPVDLVDLSEKSLFNSLIIREGKKIYDKSS
ncbi:hypothetical protein A2291_06610 [candidate division WOR-1 bacterium RIFOXYB2_FULL_42_35]|uniref:Polymerase beta nucleotidyltransferase domain-containing protein n=1 Tax=candidate division WOR-1 bacterium RIFOXYC2_FULL_41_25 TaxID=1802586 RepID=A0A1F4TPP8_UNCSA|nr:MAG: hypothetical protein A2291_06610 [candidate division WOR-1 bacterium RIFOXYB2_FULL_42_35]OGC24552.1 MAG: hypothetical protein A2247_06390 [candidate division WOR-1 bacterium RIFOXYA2_FULL_41_14]OGC34597.1 MAG: hypothetical protein A2462_04625 [candidate division WOR-1 bacterium RIFOXYC2_FULL_41_25]